MRLTLIQFFKATVPGHIFRGKRRLVKPVSLKAMDTLQREYERQEKIMLLLRHPYLSVVRTDFLHMRKFRGTVISSTYIFTGRICRACQAFAKN